jgi:Sulfotransferase domain
VTGTKTFLERADEKLAVKPNFLIVGAAKSGTTSLHEYLDQHPEIFMSALKEPNYFVPGCGYDSWQDYLALFAAARGETAIGESSTGYLYCEQSPALIKATLGEIKIVLILRNPARRAASLYWWMVREGYENARSFAEALELESARMRSSTFQQSCPQFYPDYLYYTTGLYSQQVRRYLDIFGRKNVRVYIFEEFVREHLVICRDVFDFLGVDPNFNPRIEVHNEARVPAYSPLQYWLRNRAGRYLPFLPSPVRRQFLGQLMALNTKGGSTPSHDSELGKSLMNHYRADVAELEQLINRDLSLWYDSDSKQN